MEACDTNCQKKKTLQKLLAEYERASNNAGKDPEGYEKAKIAYFSLRDGPEWLHDYKQFKAERDATQMLKKYKTKLPPIRDTTITEDDYTFAKTLLQEKEDKSDVSWRMYEFSNSSTSWIVYFQYGLEIVLVLYICYKLFSGLNTFKSST